MFLKAVVLTLALVAVTGEYKLSSDGALRRLL